MRRTRRDMSIALEVHFGFAFFVLLAAVLVGWVQMGRRVMSGFIGIQVLIGIVVAAWFGAARVPLPGVLWIHVLAALLAMFAYIAGRRIYDKTGKALPAIGMSLIGFALLILTAAYGLRMVYGGH